MKRNHHSSVTIKFHFDQKYQDWVKQGAPQRWISISLTIGGEDVYGGSRATVTGDACIVMIDLLESVTALKSDSRSVVHFDQGPSFLSVGPENTTAVEIAACHTLKEAKNPEERLGVARSYITTRELWEDAVTEMGANFYQTVTELNPELEEHDVIKEIDNRISDIRN
ncbi:hypothetical protein ACFQJ7_08730 [Halovenus rubra]|uniref:Uncharacterized protein n=2 Tax=Halovenus rubra TaxID=869890 RepID=A0ACC7E4Q7_9EURY|nr:hypothetical protein [Halovenus rubra]